VSDDGINWYLRQAGRVPMLTPSEEISLGNEVKAYMELRDLKEPTLKERKIIKRGMRAKDRMFNANLRLVVHISKKYAEATLGSMTMLDLIQEGNLGLSRAIEKFDPTRGYKFSTYAYWWIRQAVGRSICLSDRVIRLPLNAIAVQKKVGQFVEKYKEENDRIPTIEECAKFCKIRASTMRAYLEHTSKVSSLDLMMSNNNKLFEDSTILDFIVDPDLEKQQEQIEIDHGIDQLEELLAELPERDRWAMELRYGIDELGPMTYQSIGQMLNISRERVRQIEAKCLKRMRRKIDPIRLKASDN